MIDRGVPYDHRNCQSPFGYAQKAHERSKYTCELCRCGGSPPSFDLWRQFTVGLCSPNNARADNRAQK